MKAMARRRLMGLAVAFVAGMACVTTAFAVPMRAEYVGTVSDSWDNTGFFGRDAGPGLDGAAFSLTFTYDPDTPGARHVSAPGSYDQAFGGQFFGNTSPVISAVLSINGTSVTLAGNKSAVLTVIQSANGSEIAHVVQNDSDDGNVRDVSQISIDIVPRNLTNSLVDLQSVFTAADLQLLFSSFIIDRFDYATQSSTFVRGSLLPTRVTVRMASVTPVPLPAGLPMLGLSLAVLLGVGKRARHSFDLQQRL
jgi:hypothetical protein